MRAAIQYLRYTTRVVSTAGREASFSFVTRDYLQLKTNGGLSQEHIVPVVARGMVFINCSQLCFMGLLLTPYKVHNAVQDSYHYPSGL